MKCPIDASELVMSERQGVEIDYCPKCRGVWLDRGELDKVLERAAQLAPAQSVSQPQRREHSHGYDKRGYRKRESWLSELFD